MAYQNNSGKNRKSEAQKAFDEADNARRFSGKDADANAAREQAKENIRQDANSSREERSSGTNGKDDFQLIANDGDANNVRDEATQCLNENDVAQASRKANEGARQGRDDLRNDNRG